MTQPVREEAFDLSSPSTPSIYFNDSTSRQYSTPLNVDRTDSVTPSAASHPLSRVEVDSVSPISTSGSSSAIEVHHKPTQQYFRSRRIKKGEIEHPWQKAKKDLREKWVTIIPLVGLALGFAIAGFLVYDGLRTIVHHNYNLILDEDWSHGFRTDIWHKEVTVGGFGNGEFDQTTKTDENIYVQNGKLYIKPTLQDAGLITSNNNLSLGADCTGTSFYDCNAVTNTTNGTIVPPVKSGRINTNGTRSIKYGRVEVTATLPQGDWLWPAIWLLPVNSSYGEWPKSGEIDVMESRGNNYTYAQGGNNIISSALHWGPNGANDNWWQTNVKRNALHTTFSKKEHTFGLEWSEKYLFTYIDTRLLQVLYTPFTVPLWQRGHFPLSDSNGTTITNPWVSGGVDAPFDQEFFLVLNVAVGGTNGWFEDGKSGKPWVDKSPTAKKDFWDAKDQWYPTWRENGQMVVSRVRMWQQIDQWGR